MRTCLAVLVAAVLVTAAPRRSLDYAESGDRLVYAFVFGSQDTCRVIRRPAVPRLDFETLARKHYPPEWRGEPGEVIVAEFVFGSGRPLHIVPLNDGKLLVAFVNRSPDGAWPTEDRVHVLAEKDYAEPIDYTALPPGAPPHWPEPERALPHKPLDGGAPASLSYAFVAREDPPGRLLVARQSEGDNGGISEIVAFAIDTATRKAALPRREELLALLDDPEELLAAGAAWALGLDGTRDVAARLKTAKVASGPARAAVAQAMVRCGDDAGRKALRALLGNEDAATRRAAAYALAELPPATVDADALAEAAADEDAGAAEFAGMALARMGQAARSAVMRLSHASKSEKRVAAARILGRMDGAEEEARLLALACDPDAQTAAARALTRPPRAIRKENFASFGKALQACARTKNAEAARRLSMLMWQAHVEDEGAVAALVDCTTLTPRAIWALNKMQGTNFVTADDCKRWLMETKKK